MNPPNASISVDRVRELIANPHEVAGSDLEALRKWRDRFPYAPVFGVLVAKAAAEFGSVDQQAELLRAAANMASREALFELLVRPNLVQEARDVAQEIDEILEVQGELEEDENTPPEQMPAGMEREALLVAIESSIAQDVKDWQSEQALPEMAIQDEPNEGPVLSPFAAWLSRRAQVTGFGESKPRPEHTPTPQGQSALIDAFIAASPRIGKMREVGREVEDLARESVLEDPSLVTETMARVYAKQGQIGRARKAYKLLALKFPAKSTYFAAQLKQLGKSLPSSDS